MRNLFLSQIHMIVNWISLESWSEIMRHTVRRLHLGLCEIVAVSSGEVRTDQTFNQDVLRCTNQENNPQSYT